MINDNLAKIEVMLLNYNRNKAAIKNINIQIELEEDNYYSVGSITYDKINSKTNRISSSVENTVINNDKEHRDNRINSLKSRLRLAELQVECVDNALSLLDDTKRKIIEGIYMKNKKGKDMAIELDLCERTISNYKKEALRSMADTL